ncbi:glucokinase [Lachnospiraceae bacterium]|nr:glucokinase [Lachnospiraceae bacterium]
MRIGTRHGKNADSILQLSRVPGRTGKMYRAGIDLGGTNIKAGIIDENHKILAQTSAPIGVERPAEEVIADMAVLVRQLMDTLGMDESMLAGIGVGCPGLVDADVGVVRYSNNISWENVALVKELGNYFSCEIRISNDANCAALGEVKAGAAKNVSNAILLTLGTGVGGGIILDGKVFEGSNAGGAELGHISMILGGEPCTCGRRGCVEAYVSATALIRDAKRAAAANKKSLLNQMCGGVLEHMNGRIPFDAALAGDKVAKEVVENYYTYLAEAVANYVNIFRPDVVILAGGVCRIGCLTASVEEHLSFLCYGGDRAFVPPVRCAILGNHAGMIGAANLITVHRSREQNE